MSTSRHGRLRPLEGNHCLTDPYFYPIFEEASRLDLAIAVHIAKGNPDSCDLLCYLLVLQRAFEMCCNVAHHP